MIYSQVYDRFGLKEMVRAGVIGAGHYATAVVTQSASIPRLQVPVVADISAEAARSAFLQAGYAQDDIILCESRASAISALESGKRVVLTNAMLMMDLPLDVIVEATGSPTAGALYASEAVKHGKHVANVNKEAGCTVGPMLKRLADQAGVVYTEVDGDQPGLLIAMVAWAHELGLEVLCGGKARDIGLTYDAAAGSVYYRRGSLTLDASQVALFARVEPGRAVEFVEGRKRALGELGQIGHQDYEELTIAANATGLAPDVESLHFPPVRTVEIPEVLSPLDEGGILRKRGAIETVTCLCGPDEADLGGGVFIVVTAATEYSRYILATKGCISNHTGAVSLIYRPYHLCGVETAISVLTAGLLGLPTGAIEHLPRFDTVGRALRDIRAGEDIVLGDLQSLMLPAAAIGPMAPLPTQMAYGNAAAVDIPTGTLVTGAMVQEPEDSPLWSLRREQDAIFDVPTAG